MRRGIEVIALVTCMAFAFDAHGQTPADVDAARELFREAAAASADGDWAIARDKYQRSLTLKWSALTLRHLATAQRETGALAAALESLRSFVQAPQSDKSQPYVAGALVEIDELSKRVARVTVRITGSAQPTLIIDGLAVPAAALGVPRLVDPGRHTIATSAPGHERTERTIELAEGQLLELQVALAPLPADLHSRRSLAEPPRAAPESSVRPLAGAIAMMAGGGAMALTGLGLGVAAYVRADGVTDGTPEAQELWRMGVAADVLMPTGLVTAAIGLILQLALPPTKGGERAASTSPWSSGAASGVAIQF